jgi:hypothetical protein
MSCDITTLIAPPPAATLGPDAINVIVARTAEAAATQTAALVPPTLTPSPTLFPTRTATVTPSPTATFLFLLATRSKTPTPGPASGDYACTLINQSPDDGATMSRNEDFTVSWKVRNTGSVTWDSNAVDFIYLSGAKMATVRAIDLATSVDPDETITLKVNMSAPGNDGNYKSVWTLRQGRTQFCRLNIEITVP